MLRPFADLQYADAVLAHIHFAQIVLLINYARCFATVNKACALMSKG